MPQWQQLLCARNSKEELRNSLGWFEWFEMHYPTTSNYIKQGFSLQLPRIVLHPLLLTQFHRHNRLLHHKGISLLSAGVEVFLYHEECEQEKMFLIQWLLVQLHLCKWLSFFCRNTSRLAEEQMIFRSVKHHIN